MSKTPRGRATTKFEPLLDEDGDVIEGCFSATVNDVAVGAVGKTTRNGASGWGWVVTPGDKGSAERYSWPTKVAVWPTRRNTAMALYVASQINKDLDIKGAVDEINDAERRLHSALCEQEQGLDAGDLRLVLTTLETTRDALEEAQEALEIVKEDLQIATDLLEEAQAELKALKGTDDTTDDTTEDTEGS